MANIYEPNYKHINEIYFKEIIFEQDLNTSDVTIFGYREDPYLEELQEVDYVCPFSILTELLMFAGDSANPIIGLIGDKLDDKVDEYPVIIDVENLLGKPLKIDKIVLTIYKPMEQDENGEWKETEDDNFYLIDNVEPEEIFESKKNNSNNLSNELAEYFAILDNAFKFYMQLIGIGITEKEARKKSGLKDELLFRMAKINHRINKKGE